MTRGSLALVLSRLREKRGPHDAERHGEDEGDLSAAPLTFPIAAQWAPFLSRKRERMYSRHVSRFLTLLPSWEKADAAQRRPDEGAPKCDGHLSWVALPLTRLGPTALAALSHKGRGE